ncbi:hypothetical protein KNO15_05000 [Leifsonia shinshuensis]|uniref:hypothetical protein n=1 Tax=Leifsonia shinshuensis TaxID=150026 RepID=UPI001F515507|nr:hypothetical protein [Leifsonia shinshuensis]MCI0156052.1 hypothetical protein [Leifsonia shinshuensis]
MGPSGSAHSSVGPKALPAIGILIATWLLMWLAQGVPTVCALAYPCPADDVRVAPALTFGALMLVPVAVLIATAGTRRPFEGMRLLAYVLLVGLAVVGLGAVLFSGGFAVPHF